MHPDTMKYLLKLIHEECGGDKTVVDSLWSEIQSEVEEVEEVMETQPDDNILTAALKAKLEKEELITDILKYFLPNPSRTMSRDDYGQIIEARKMAQRPDGIRTKWKSGNHGAVSSLKYQVVNGKCHSWMPKIQREFGSIIQENDNGTVSLSPRWKQSLLKVKGLR